MMVDVDPARGGMASAEFPDHCQKFIIQSWAKVEIDSVGQPLARRTLEAMWRARHGWPCLDRA